MSSQAGSPEAPDGGTLADAVESVHRALASRSPADGVAAITLFEKRLRGFEHPALDDVARDLASLRTALAAPSVDGGAVARLLTELASRTERALDGAGPAGQPLAHLSGLLAQAGEELAGGR
jgi:hypothetical protein